MEIFALLIPAVIYVILIIVLYSIIKMATKSDLLHKESIRQSLSLEAIARNQDVTEQELVAINKSLEKVTAKK